MDFFQRLGNLFGGNGFVSDDERKKKKQAEQNQQRQSQVQPQRTQAPGMPLGLPGVQTPQQNQQAQQEQAKRELTLFQGPVVPEKPQQKPAPGNFQTGVDALLQKPKVVTTSKTVSNPLIDIGKNIISSVQQGAGRIADVAVQGGSVLTQLGNNVNPFISEEERKKRIINDANTSDKLRKGLQVMADVSGEKIQGTKSADEAAGRIAAGRGDARDVLNVAGTGLQTGIDATTFLNPANLVKGGLTKTQIAKQVARDAGFFGGTQGGATAAQEYGAGADLPEALGAGLESGLTTGATAGLFDVAGAGFGRMLKKGEAAPGIESVNPTREADSMIQAVNDSERAGRPLYDPTSNADPLTSNEPAFVRQQQDEVVRQQIQDDVLNAAPPDVTDIPAYQRQGKTLPSQNIAGKQARIDELKPVIEALPSESEVRATEFRLKQQYANDLREHPELKKELTQKLKDNMDQVKADAEVAKASRAEHDALQSEVAQVEQQIKVAQQLQKESQAPTAPAQTLKKPEATLPKEVKPAPSPTIPAKPAPKTEPVGKDINVPTKAKQVEAPVKSTTMSDAMATLTKPEKPAKKTPQAELPAAKVGDTAKTGETGKSSGKFSRGQEYEKTSIEASQKRGANAAGNESYETFVDKVTKADGMSGPDRDTAVAIQKRYKPGTKEHRALGDLVNKYNTEAAQSLATIERTLRRTADSKQLTDRFANKLYSNLDDNVTFNDKDFDAVLQKNEDFTVARDARNEAIETFNTDPSKANEKSVIEAFNKMDEADRAAKFEEYKVASNYAKKNKNPKAKKFVDKLEQDAGVYTMDWVDSSLLSSTRVMLNNFLNTFTGRAEEQIFGKAGAALARQLTGGKIGGGSIRGGRLGAKLGDQNLIASTKLRGKANGNALVKGIKNFSTTGNTLGERNTSAAAYSGIYDHYRTQLKKEGYKGAELELRSVVNSLADPDEVTQTYMNQALTDNAMSSFTAGKNRTKFESWLTDGLAKKMGDSALAKVGAKALTRVTVGFPTVILRSAQQGAKRSLLGTVSLTQALVNVARKGDKEVTAQYIKNSVKEAGSGATMIGIGSALGAAGLITGAYPSDKNEQAQWKREGKTENSIKIGDSWYSLPAALGIFALPFMLGANAGKNASEGKGPTENITQTTIQTLIDSMPTDSLLDALKFLDDAGKGKDVSKYIAQTGSSLVKAVTPLGSLVNQFAKIFDGTANDTTQGDVLAQFMAKVQDGIPGAANQLPNKKVEGNEIENPSPIARLMGASSKEQGTGVAKTAEIKQQVNEANTRLKDNGIFNDKIKGVLDDETKLIFDRAKGNEEIDADEMKKLISGITKNVGADSDTRFLEDGDYDNNLAVLKTKREMLESDPTTRKSDLEKYDKQIKRGEVYKEDKTGYDMIEKYRKIGLEEWRDFGDPESDTFNEDLYKKLYDLDSKMTDAGVSRNSKDEAKNKYYAKPEKKKKAGGKGRGGAGANSNAAGGKISPVDLKDITLGKLSPKEINDVKIPKIDQIKSTDLIKKRKISVGKA